MATIGAPQTRSPSSQPATREYTLQERNVIGGSLAEKFYEINGRRVYLEIDGQPVESYFPR